MSHEVSDPLMHESGPEVFWTTVNAAEARPGVSTPLSQSFWGNAAELAARQAFCDMGIIPQSMVVVGPADENISAVFYGRCAANVDTLRRIADRAPGMSGDGFERQFLGAVRDGIPSNGAPLRLPIIAVKAPAVLATSARMMRRMEPEYQAWWEQRTSAPTASTGMLNEALRRFMLAEWMQLRVTYLAQGIFDNVAELAASAGLEGLERRLVSGYGTLVENRIVADMDAVAGHRLDLATFRRRWGFHGPREGELMSLSWRESTDALERAIDGYRGKEPEDPTAAAARRAGERGHAERELLSSLSRTRRPTSRLLLRLVRTYVPLREVGKAIYVQSIDAARASARAIGAEWSAGGSLQDPEDIFFLTLPEIGRGPRPEVSEIVAVRRARHLEYERVELPAPGPGRPIPSRSTCRTTPRAGVSTASRSRFPAWSRASHG